MLDAYIDALAQLETAGGKKTIKGPNGEDSNNLFNIKDFSGQGYRALDKAEGSRDAYRVYGSRDEAKADLKGLLARKYPKALEAKTPEEFFGALKDGGYATDPMYVAKGVSVAKRMGAPMAAQQAQQADLTPFIEGGWGAEVEFARKLGKTDSEILAKLQEKQVELRSQQQARAGADARVAELGAQGKSAIDQLTVLRQVGFNDEIEFARGLGKTPEEIVAKLAPIAQQRGAQAHQKQVADGSVVTGLKSAGDTATGLVRGTRQAFNQVTGDAETLKRLQQEEAAARSDLDRVARDSSVAGKVGSVAPYLAAALIPGAQTTLGGAAVGAGIGLAQPTVEGESRLANTALGAVGGGGANAALKGAGLAGRVASRSNLTPENQVLLAAEGITPSRAMTSKAGAMIESLLGRVPGSRLGVASGEDLVQKQAQAAIARRLGIEGTELSSDAINAAEAAQAARFQKALGNTIIDIPDELRGSLHAGLTNQIKNANPMVKQELIKEFGSDLAALKSGGGIQASTLNKLRSQLGSDGASANLSAAEKIAYGKTRQAVTDVLEARLPAEQLKALKEANEFHKNLMIGRDVVAKMKDDPSRDVIKALEQAVTAAKNRKDLTHGTAPMQDLQQALSSLSRDKGTLDDIIGGNTAGMVAPLAALHTGGASLLLGLPANALMRILNTPAGKAELSRLNPVAQAQVLKKITSAQAAGALAS